MKKSEGTADSVLFFMERQKRAVVFTVVIVSPVSATVVVVEALLPATSKLGDGTHTRTEIIKG